LRYKKKKSGKCLPSVLFKTLKVRIWKTVRLSVDMYGYKMWHLLYWWNINCKCLSVRFCAEFLELRSVK
jgi:hypothetical protein